MVGTVGIAGAGLIGGSIALRAARLGWRLGVYDRASEHARFVAERAGADFIATSFEELAERSTTLVLAAPLDATLAQVGELSNALPPGLELVLDVASVKAPVARAAHAIPVFLATHPIAGSERSGPAAARADLFEGRVWSYDADAPESVRARGRAFVEAMGARPVAIASAEHDRIVALTSHLPQVASVALAALVAPHAGAPDVAALSGPGLRSMLRLAGSSWIVWEAVLRANAGPLAQEVRQLAAILTEFAEALERDAPATLAERFAQAATAHNELYANGPER